MITTSLQKRLQTYQDEDLIRERFEIHQRKGTIIYHNKQKYINFCSSDYLGLSGHPDVIKAFKKGVDKYGVGSGASPLISGYYKVHREFEEALANFVERDRAILLSSGFLANLAVMSALVDKQDNIFSDKFCHASILDAIRMTKAKHYRFAHNDVDHLSRRLSYMNTSSSEQTFIVTESVFSMSGDLANLIDLIAVANKVSGILIVDEAHALGILGKEGAGLCSYLALTQNQVPLLICPLGKAFGMMGGVIAGPQSLIECVLQFARPYIYSTAIPPANACAALASLELIKQQAWRREKLNSLIELFKTTAMQYGIPILPSIVPIQSIIVGNNFHAFELSRFLLSEGFYVTAIRPPTVPINSARLRVSLSCLHHEKHIIQMLGLIAEYLEANKIRESLSENNFIHSSL